MALIDQVRALVDAGATEQGIKQSLRQVMDERQLAEHSATLPNIPTIGPAMWSALKAKLLQPDGPTNKFEMLVRLHNALDADDQAAFFQALFGMVKAVWHEHPAWRRSITGPTIPPV